MRFKKILCPTDFSEHAREALRVATELAQESGGEITVLHVYSIPAIGYSEGAFAGAEFLEGLSAQVDKDLRRWKEAHETSGGPRLLIEKRLGVDWDEIVNLAADRGCDLIVLGSHGRTGLKRALLGSVAEKVARHAPCPVLIVRSPIT